MKNNWYEDPSDAYEVGKNWCISVPFHELKLIEEAKVLAKKRNCKSVAQLVRKVVWNEIHEEKNPKVSIPKEYLDYVFRAICHFDMYDEELTDRENDAFHYIYSLCSEHGCHERSALKLKNEET